MMSRRSEREPVDIDIPDFSEDAISATHGTAAGGRGDLGPNVNVGGYQSLNIQGGTNYFYSPITFGGGNGRGDGDTLTENQKRWLIVGICLNSVVTPVLRAFVTPIFQQLYTTLVQDESIDAQTYVSHLKHYPDGNLEFLNYEPINNNKCLPGPNQRAIYDYCVRSPVDLSKLFLRTSMAFHTGFDDTCDASALLTFLIKVVDFGDEKRDAAQKVKDEVRNPWGHCNFTQWTKQRYNASFDLMWDLITSLYLPSQAAANCMDSLTRWRINGESFLSGSIAGQELVHNLTNQIKNLQSHVQKLAEQTRIELLQNCEAFGEIEDNFDGINTTLSRFEREMTSIKVRLGIQEFIAQDHENRLQQLENTSKQRIGNKFFIVPGSKRTFIGRREYLEIMENYLIGSEQVENCKEKKIVLCGLGGVGKTSIAMEYIWRNHQEHYQGGVFWISGENDEAFNNSIRSIASCIGTLGKDSRETILSTLNYISLRQRRCLLILDNADEDILSADIQSFAKNRLLWDFHDLIITTRRKLDKAQIDFDSITCLSIHELSKDEAFSLVDRILNNSESYCNDDIQLLCKKLQYLPLALEQASTKIKLINCSILDYLEEFEKVRLKLLNNPIDRQSVLTTWTINIDGIKLKGEQNNIDVAVNSLLPLIAYLAKDDIVLSMFNTGVPPHQNEELRDILHSEFKKKTVIGLFTEFSILRSEDGKTFRVHSLVQEAIRNQFSSDDSELHRIASCAVAMLNKAADDDPANIDLLIKIEKQCSSLIHHFRRFEDIRKRLYHLLNRVSTSADTEVRDEIDVDKLRSYFIKRNYPLHIVDHALQKASSLTRDIALRETAKRNVKMVPYVITYNPSLPKIGEIINKYWGLLALSQKSSMKYVFQHKPVLAFKRPCNLGDILTHSKLNFRKSATGSVSSCKRRRCTHCKNINESSEFICSNTNEAFSVRSNFDCTSENVIYLITCKKCHAQYVGQTHQKVSKRMNSHRFDIFHHPENFTNVSLHFNENGHTLSDFSFAPIDRIEAEWPRLLKETYWMHRLDTIYPKGMNSKARVEEVGRMIAQIGDRVTKKYALEIDDLFRELEHQEEQPILRFLRNFVPTRWIGFYRPLSFEDSIRVMDLFCAMMHICDPSRENGPSGNSVKQLFENGIGFGKCQLDIAFRK